LIGNEASKVSDADWAVYGLNVFGVISLVAGLPYTQTDGTAHEPASTEFMLGMSLVINLATLGCAIWAYIKDGKTDGVSNAEFAEQIIETIVGMINPAKLTGEDGAAAVVVFDALGGIIAVCAAACASAPAGAGRGEAVIYGARYVRMRHMAIMG
jgi:hypothetical protein